MVLVGGSNVHKYVNTVGGNMDNKNTLNQNAFSLKSNILGMIAIAILSIYCIKDFANHQNYIIGLAYLVIIGVGAYLSMSKAEFVIAIGTLINCFGLCQIVKTFLGNEKGFELLSVAFEAAKLEREIIFLKRLFVVNYAYIYIVCIILFLVATIVGKYLTPKLNALFKCLGLYSCVALVLQCLAMYYSVYKKVAAIIFVIFAIYAFVSAYYAEKFETSKMLKAVFTTVIWIVLTFVHPEEAFGIIESTGKLLTIDWYYLVGLILMALFAVMSKDSKENNMFGISLISSFLYIYFLNTKYITYDYFMFLFLHIFAISIYKVIKNTFVFDKNITREKSFSLIVYTIGYICSFVLTTFVSMNLFPAVAAMLACMLVMMIYGFGIKEFDARFYDIAVMGITPWVLLEVTLNVLGKLRGSIITTVIFTAVFWLILGVGLAWKDYFKLPAFAIDKKISKIIIRVLTIIPLVLVLVTLCQTESRLILANDVIETEVETEVVKKNKKGKKVKTKETEIVEEKVVSINLVTEMYDEKNPVEIVSYSYQWDFGKEILVDILDEEQKTSEILLKPEGKFLKVWAVDSEENHRVGYLYVK